MRFVNSRMGLKLIFIRAIIPALTDTTRTVAREEMIQRKLVYGVDRKRS